MPLIKLEFVKVCAFYILLVCVACSSTQTMRPIKETAVQLGVSDSLPIETLIKTIDEHINFLSADNEKAKNEYLVFGDRKVLVADYITTLQKFVDDLKNDTEASKNLPTILDKYFAIYEVAGWENWGEVFISGYYDPIITGSKKATKELTQPIYKKPNDLVFFDVDAFASVFEKYKILQDKTVTQRDDKRLVTGRLAEDKKIVPYYNRKEIDIDKKLNGSGLEICWVDPIDAFFLHIQGSGIITLENGKQIWLGYDNKNGRPYSSLGKRLIAMKKIEKENMSMQNIIKYLKTLSYSEMMDLLAKNESYVFFKELKGSSLSFLGTALTEGRSIATDRTKFPKGVLAFLDVEEPILAAIKDNIATEYERKPRMVFDNDTGGAILGTGRVDLYFGVGKEAGEKAGTMRKTGKLYYFVPKELE